ncbi:MAG: energy transducer TonB [Pontiellaceae bacterium]|nr:energy transducer TonB [Pontiellaceae bacterium]MBN2784779.1 energy transducer TonB [Pontiellaceae bacterium]
MQDIRSIVFQPILPALLLSVAVHAFVMGRHGLAPAPAALRIDEGKTVVQLTLVPSPTPKPEPINTPRPEPEPIIEATQQLKPIDIPKPIKRPEESVAPTPAPEAEPVQPESTPAPPAQDASMEPSKGISSETFITGVFKPAYPRISRRRGEQGTVILSVHVLTDGSVGSTTVIKSSGFRRLDESALKEIRQAIFTPATLQGQAVESDTEISCTFRLTDD